MLNLQIRRLECSCRSWFDDAVPRILQSTQCSGILAPSAWTASRRHRSETAAWSRSRSVWPMRIITVGEWLTVDQKTTKLKTIFLPRIRRIYLLRSSRLLDLVIQYRQKSFCIQQSFPQPCELGRSLMRESIQQFHTEKAFHMLGTDWRDHPWIVRYRTS